MATERALADIAMVVDGLDHPECVAVGPAGELWAGGEAGQVYRINPMDGTVTLVGETGGFILGITPDGDGHVWLCDLGRHQLLCMDAQTGTIVHAITEVDGRPLTNPNYAVFGPDGRLYVSDSGTSGLYNGFVFVVTPLGESIVIDATSGAFPNGLALSQDSSTLFIVESEDPGVRALDLPTGESRGFVALPGRVPDGLALAANGDLYVACYRPDEIIRVTPDGRVYSWLLDPRGMALSAPTNVAFGGADYKDLFIASLGRWHIGRIRTDSIGVRPHYPQCAEGRRVGAR